MRRNVIWHAPSAPVHPKRNSRNGRNSFDSRCPTHWYGIACALSVRPVWSYRMDSVDISLVYWWRFYSVSIRDSVVHLVFEEWFCVVATVWQCCQRMLMVCTRFFVDLWMFYSAPWWTISFHPSRCRWHRWWSQHSIVASDWIRWRSIRHFRHGFPVEWMIAAVADSRIECRIRWS